MLALYQQFWQEEGRYRTAALFRHDDQWIVLVVEFGFGGVRAEEVSCHGGLEDARKTIVRWVGKAREVNAGKVPGSVMDQIDGYRRELGSADW